MKKFLGSIKRNGSVSGRANGHKTAPVPQGDSPQAVVVREVTAFCEAGAPNAPSNGDEYLHLPAIVDAAESSPPAAKEAAATIRRFLSKDHYQRGFAQYNAIMLMRILTDNPARTFTQNFDDKFVSTVKALLRDGKDTSVQQILRETLDYFEAEKAQENDTLQPLIEMWRREKGKSARIGVSRNNFGGAAKGGPGYAPPPPPPRGLPSPDELAGRIEEAKTTARLLVQTVQSTPTSELLGNELVREFGDRARAAHNSIQGFMQCENPAPDTQTMLTMIETNEQLNIAMSKHQRAVLQARQQLGVGTPSPQPPQGQQTNSYVYPQVQSHTDPYAYGGQPHQNQLQPPLQPQMQAQKHQPASYAYSQEQQHAEPYGVSQQQPQPHPAFQRQADYHSQVQGDHVPYETAHLRQSTPQTQQKPFAGGTPQSPIDDDFYAGSSPPRTQKFSQPAHSDMRPEEEKESHYRPTSQSVMSPTSTQAYGIAENPFGDDAGYNAPQQNSNSVFDRDEEVPTVTATGFPHRPNPNPYNEGYQPTPSYIHRQDSSAEHVTMHGASPPSGIGAAEQRLSPVSPLDEESDISRRMNNVRM